MPGDGLAIVAGRGDLPRLIAEDCARRGRDYRVVVFEGIALDWLGTHPAIPAVFEKPGRLFADLRAAGCGQVVFAGGMRRPGLNPMRFDLKALSLAPKLLAGLRAGDDSTLRAVAKVFEAEGLTLRAVQEVLSDLLAPAGVLTRAAPGGTGAAKCGGNYAAALAAQAEAARQGCEQVVFLDAVERRWIEELAGMNVFFVFEDGSLQTPPLTGTILPGVTRDSLIQLARDKGMTVREAPYAIDEWRRDLASGKLVEVFACGTAAVVAPISQIKGQGFDLKIGDGGMGPVTADLRKSLTDIQFGRAADPHGWTDRIL